jgi:inner membrane protein
LLAPIQNQKDVQQLIRFSQGYYTVERWHDTLVFNDLRFGQVVGWYDHSEKFVFHYFLQQPEKSNRFVMQRGRFERWNRKTIRSLQQRIVDKDYCGLK